MIFRLRKNTVTGLLATMILLGCAMIGGAQAETISGAIYLGDLPRTYRLYLPSGPAPTAPRPLVIVLHGGGSNGEDIERMTRRGFNTLADKEGFVVVYPDGIENRWNDGRKTEKYRTHRENIDDVGFISALIDYLAKDYHLDKSRVYATGFSNGGMMANRLGCKLTGKIAGIAPVAGNLPCDLMPCCSPSRPISVLQISGTKDPMIPWGGGEAGFLWAHFGRLLSVAESIKFWVDNDHCSPTPVVTELPDRDPDDGTRVRRELYGGGRDSSEVILYAVEGGGHAWPGGEQFLPQLIVGKTSRDLNACEVIWEFFKRHRLETESESLRKAAKVKGSP
jgi:polyhydroxybutyrate depolymerase